MGSSATVGDVMDAIERIAPRSLAMSGDNIGLLVGERAAPVTGALLALDATEDAVLAAGKSSAELVIAHHPVIYRPIQSIRTDTLAGRAIRAALAGGVSVVAAHTNLDAADIGTAATLADALGLLDVELLEARPARAMIKLVVFLSEGDLDPVRSAICRAGAGVIGEYDFCTWRAAGVGSFRGSGKANPTIGRRGRLEEVAEFRLETVVPAALMNEVVAALVDAHSYEEPAYDLYPLAATAGGGLGRIGRLDSATTLDAFAADVAKKLRAPAIRIAGRARGRVSRVAVAPGSGGSVVEEAASTGADVLVTGEIGYHHGLEAVARGLAVVAAGHAETERIALKPFARALRDLVSGVTFRVQRPPRSVWRPVT